MPALMDRNPALHLSVVSEAGSAEALTLMPGGAAEDAPPAPAPAPVTGRSRVQFQATMEGPGGRSGLVTGRLEMLVRDDDSWELTMARKGAAALTRRGSGDERLVDVLRQMRIDCGLDPAALA